MKKKNSFLVFILKIYYFYNKIKVFNGWKFIFFIKKKNWTVFKL